MLGIGPDAFADLLAGFHLVDEHFRSAPLEANAPVLLGLLGVWYSNFWDAQTPRRPALQPGVGPLPRLSPAARHGEQRQVGHPAGRP